MLFSKNRLIYFSIVGFCLIVVDQLAKHLAISNPNFTFFIIRPWFGWELFKNPGVAFGLPIPNILLVVGTPLLLLFLGLQLARRYNHPKTSSAELLGYFLILAGAVSNYFDRVIYGVTIDYWRIIYSVINLADISIIIGLWLIVRNHNQSIDS